MSVVRRLDESAGAVPSRVRSLTDLQLKALKPRDKAYKVSDRDGLYAYVSPSGTISLHHVAQAGCHFTNLTRLKMGHDMSQSPYAIAHSPFIGAAAPAVHPSERDALTEAFRRVLNTGVHGLCFSPYLEGQAPGSQVSPAQIRARLGIFDRTRGGCAASRAPTATSTRRASRMNSA
jgi:hypothetical protein